MGEGFAGFLSARAGVAPAIGFALGVAYPGDHPLLKLIAAGFLLGAWRALGNRPGAWLSLLAAFAAAGAGLSGLRARPGQVPGWLGDGQDAVIEGTVEQAAASRALLSVARAAPRPDAPLEPARFRCWLSGTPPDLLPGERLRVLAHLFAPRPPLNPGQADLAARDRLSGVARRAVMSPGALLRLAPAPWTQRLAAQARTRFDALAQQAIPDDRQRALVATLAVGERAGLDPAINERFNASGLAHILSVSGLHIAVVALGLLAVLRWLLLRSEALAIRVDVKRLAGLLALPAIWGYVLLTGSEAPAVRSGLMATALIAARLLGREPEGWSSLAWAGVAILAYDPASLRDVSFQLSFAAVLGLLALFRPLRRLVPVPTPPPGARGWGARLATLREAAIGGAVTSAAASLATGPIVAQVFHRESLVSAAANVVALPIASALTAVAALAAALCPFGLAARALLAVAAPLARSLIAVADGFGALPFAQVRVASPSPFTLVLYYAAIGCIPFLAEHVRARRIAGASLVALLALAGWRQAAPRLDRELTVTFLSVGQGDSTFVRFPGGETLLIDGGGEVGTRFDPGETILAPFLWEQGIGALDAMALSHPHPDHALGLISLAKLIPPHELWVARGNEPGGLLQALIDATHGARLRTLAAGDALPAPGGVAVEALGPPPGVHFDKVNDQSLVLRLTYGAVSFLLPGDAEEAEEQSLLDAGRPLASTVLKAPHHGSSTSSTAAFVERVSPRYVVFCVGAHNRFGFPSEAVDARYAARGCQRLRTDRDGAIAFRTDGKDLRVERFVAR